MNRNWTDKDIIQLKALYPCNSNEVVAATLKRSVSSVKGKALKLKLKKKDGHHHWTQKEIEYLQANYANTHSQIIADYLGCNTRRVYFKARQLGLKKSAAFLCSEESGRLYKGHQKGYNTMFKKGHPTWNKGVKGDEYKMRVGANYERMTATQFKPGQMTHNHKPVGSTRFSKDGYYEVKTGEPRTWKQLHRILWEEAHGEIPKHHCVVFRDGNPRNCVLENLELITRSEHAVRNRHKGWSKYPEELKKVIHTLSALKRKINNAKKQIN